MIYSKVNKKLISQPWLAVVPLCLLGLYLRFGVRMRQELGGDELYQLQVIDKPFLDFIRDLPKADFCSYLNGDYFLMYPFLKLFGFNKLLLAIPHFILTVSGFYLLYVLCKRYFRTIWAYLITFSIACFNATLVAHALEIRTYAVLPTLALGVFLVMEDTVTKIASLSFSQKRLAWVFCVFVTLFHPYGILMLAFVTFYLLLTLERRFQTRKTVGEVMWFCCGVFLTALPLWCISILGEHRAYDWQHIQNVFQYIPSPVNNVAGFLKGIFCNLIGYKAFYVLSFALFFPFLLPYDARFKQILFFLVLIILPIGTILLLDLKSGYWFLQRQFIWVMPFWAFLLGWSWDCFIDYFQRKINSSPTAMAKKI